jgi:hypothetical protein
MDSDLQDLLALWLGDHDPGDDRRAALLARLRGDETFRAAFVADIRLHGMLKAVQAPEPRWLRLEDEIGWSAEQADEVDALAERVVGEWDRTRRNRRRTRWALAATTVALFAACVYLLFHIGRKDEPRPQVPVSETNIEKNTVATIIQMEGVESASPCFPMREGELVAPGRVHIQSGRLTLAFFSGVSLTVEGPADLDVLSTDRVFLRYGKLRVRVVRGAEGFTVVTNAYEVVDLGTEFGMNLRPDGKSRVMVFEGEAAVSMFGQDGRSVRGALVERRRSVEVDPEGAGIRNIPPQPEVFVPLGEFVPGPLELAPGYPAEVLTAKPWAYWRFQSLVAGRVPNEIEGGPSLRALGGVALERSPAGNSWARFRPGAFTQALIMDGQWAPPRTNGYAIELWLQADLPSREAYGQTALVGLIAADERLASNHVAYLELAGRGRRFPHEPCAIRFLDRWPAAMTGGSDVFSRRTVVPCVWHHVVGQKSGTTLELYVDGERVGTSPASPDAMDAADLGTTACHLVVGRLKQRSLPSLMSEVRPFEGRLDELALYDRPLTPEEINRHAHFRVAGTSR